MYWVQIYKKNNMYTQIICESFIKRTTFQKLVHKKLSILEKNRVFNIN